MTKSLKEEIKARGATMSGSKIFKSMLLGTSILSSTILLAETTPSLPDAKFNASTLSSPKSIILESGWNLVSIPGYESQSITSLFNSGKIKNIWSYGENGWNLYEPNIKDEINNIYPSKGYWVNVNSGQSYTISVSTESSSSSSTTICTTEYNPVCSNGITYSNACMANAAGAISYTQGECISSSSLSSSVSSSSSSSSTSTFAKPTESECTAGGGSWNSTTNACSTNWTNGVNICSSRGGMPTKEQWLEVFKSCGADTTTMNSNGYYNDTVSGMASCMNGKGFTSDNYYWSSSEYSSTSAWNAFYDSNDNWDFNFNNKTNTKWVICVQ